MKLFCFSCSNTLQEKKMYTHTRRTFFPRGVDDENFMHLENNFDREYSDDIVSRFLHGMFILTFRECPMRENRRRNEKGNGKKRGG